MQGRIRLMKAFTPAYAHASQTCLGRRAACWFATSDFLHPSQIIVMLPTFRTTKQLVGDEFRGCGVFSNGGTHNSDGETTARWSAVVRSPLVCVLGKVWTSHCH